MIEAVLIGLPILLVGSILYGALRWFRGGPFLDPGPRSLKEMVEQNRTIIHPDDPTG
jgi:hypothetical protein